MAEAERWGTNRAYIEATKKALVVTVSHVELPIHEKD